MEADLANLEEGQIVATEDGGGDEQTLMEYVDGRLETTTTTVDMSTFKTGSVAYLNKAGNTVQFNYYAEDYTTYNPIPVGVWTEIGTIPEGFRMIVFEYPKINNDIDIIEGLKATDNMRNLNAYYKKYENKVVDLKKFQDAYTKTARILKQKEA